MSKDNWDKADVVIKFIAGILAPLLIAWVAYAWNTKATQRNTATQMIGIATAVLSQPPESGTPDALRDWAVDVLGSPANPPTLSPEAMEQLKKTGIPAWDMAAIESIKKMNDILRSIEDPPSRFPKSPLEPHPLDLP